MNVTVQGRTRHYRTVTFDNARNVVILMGQEALLDEDHDVPSHSTTHATS